MGAPGRHACGDGGGAPSGILQAASSTGSAPQPPAPPPPARPTPAPQLRLSPHDGTTNHDKTTPAIPPRYRDTAGVLRAETAENLQALLATGDWLPPTFADSFCDAGLLEGRTINLQESYLRPKDPHGPHTVVSVIRKMVGANRVLVLPVGADDTVEPQTVLLARKGGSGVCSQPWLVSAAEAQQVDQVALLTAEYTRLRASVRRQAISRTL